MSSSDEMPVIPGEVSPTASLSETAAPRNPVPAVQQALSLPPVSAVEKPPDTARRPAAKRLWLCIYLPRLPLDALRHQVAGNCAVFEERQGIRRILMVDGEARAAGVEAGMSVNAALSLRPQLLLAERDQDSEAGLVRRLAVWAERFTSFVVIEDDDALLLEIAGSLRLFGGIDRLRREIARDLTRRGLSALLAVAPTPLASLWLARSGSSNDRDPDDAARLAGRLGPVPIDCVGWPAGVTEKMQGMGVTRISDCLRLPRQGFARRFGLRVLEEIDRALGRLPDPRDRHRLPERFCADHEFDAEQDDSERLLLACRGLLLALERFLRTRQVQIQRLQFSFFHLQADATHLTLGCVQAGQGVEHWFELLRIRFEQISLPAPAIAIRLRGGRGEAASMGTSSLPGTGGRRADASIGRLIERLGARIGDDAVQGVATAAEHRPQLAWRRTRPAATPSRCAAAPSGFWNEKEMPVLLADIRHTDRLPLRRPLWLLDEPEPLPVQDGRPIYQEEMLEPDGPERIETGWWDEAGIARDYFVARTTAGRYLWIYRDRRRAHSSGWYLHGMFG